jgi:hypothetical protein
MRLRNDSQLRGSYNRHVCTTDGIKLKINRDGVFSESIMLTKFFKNLSLSNVLIESQT